MTTKEINRKQSVQVDHPAEWWLDRLRVGVEINDGFIQGKCRAKLLAMNWTDEQIDAALEQLQGGVGHAAQNS